jgi:ABC-type transporter Mla subunit MlaD
VISGTAITAIGAVVVALVAGFAGWRNSGKATMSGEQRAWLNDALTEVRQVRKELADAEQAVRAAARSANEATDRADIAERRLRQLDSSAQDLIGWIERVMRAKDQIDAQTSHDPAVARLLMVINGGPATMSVSQLHTQP